MGARTFRRYVLIAFAVLLAVLPQLPVPEFWITQANYIGLYTLVVIGLVLLTGVAGLTSFGQAAFVGLGAYTAAYLTLTYGVSPWLTLWIGLAFTAVAALVLAWVTLRMSGHFLPLATIAWGLSLYYTLGNIDALGKYDGLLESFGSFWASAFKEVIVFTFILPVLLWRSFQHGHEDEEE